MKKWLAGIGILGLSVLTLAACGNKSAESENQDTTAVETVVEEVVTPTVDTVAAVVDSTAAAVK